MCRRIVTGGTIAGAIVMMIASLTGSQNIVPSDRAYLDKYCLTCHTQGSKDRGIVPIALDKLDVSAPDRDTETWEKVIRKVRAGVMSRFRRVRRSDACGPPLQTSLESEWSGSATAWG